MVSPSPIAGILGPCSDATKGLGHEQKVVQCKAMDHCGGQPRKKKYVFLDGTLGNNVKECSWKFVWC